MKRRQGFTLVELLVAMALIIFIMAILSGAFVAAMDTFRNLKGQGDMAEKLRSVSQVLQRDLAADHFEGKKRLSNPNFWLNGPPQQGFFQIYQGSTDTLEGIDPSLIGSYYSNTHALSFTVKLRGNQMGDFFSASGGMSALSTLFGPPEARYQTLTSGGSYNYQWAAVAWFLQPQNNTSGIQDTTIIDPGTGAAALPLYTLRRRPALLVPDNSLVQPAVPTANIANFTELSCWTNGASLYFNSPLDITVPARRFWGGAAAYTASPLIGSDIQLNDVISFDVRVLPLYPGVPPVPLAPDPFVTLATPGSPFTNGTFTYIAPPGIVGLVFDTWTKVNDSLANYSTWNVTGTPGVTIPYWNYGPLVYQYPPGSAQTITLSGSGPIIQAIQISIRIWDFKTNQTRQVTIVQAM